MSRKLILNELVQMVLPWFAVAWYESVRKCFEPMRKYNPSICLEKNLNDQKVFILSNVRSKLKRVIPVAAR